MYGNAVYVFDDYLIIVFNCKAGTKRVSLSTASELCGSDVNAQSPPNILYSNPFPKGSDSGKEFFIAICNSVVSLNSIIIPCCVGMAGRGMQHEGSVERSFITIDF